MNRLKKILKWTGIGLAALVALGLMANAIFVWTTDARLERQLAAIRAAGDPLTLADLAPKPIPPEKNANTYLRRAKAGIDAILKEAEAVPDFWERFGAPGPMPEDIQKVLKSAFSAHPDVVPLLEQATACPEYDAQLDYTLSPGELIGKLLPVVQETRAAVRVLQFWGRLLVDERNYDDALRTALILFRLAEHSGRNPLLIGYLVTVTIQGIAVDSANSVLQAGPVSREVREALDAELARHEHMEGYTWAIKSERAFVLDSFRNIMRGRDFWLFIRGYWNQQESECLDVLQAYVAITLDSGPYRQTARKIRTTYSQIPQVMSAEAQLLIPAVEAAHHAVTRVRSEIRALRVLNALQTHVPAGSNETPKLTELGLPAETITDPFTGEPLHVKRTPQGWLVYSVGPNFKDDGGKLDNPINGDVGVGPPPPIAKPAENDREEKGK